jgi:hypothetical protein
MIVTDNRVSKRVGFYVRREERGEKLLYTQEGSQKGRTHETN